MQLHVLTEYEKDHIGERQALPEKYLGLTDREMDARIAAARATLGRRVVILGHHYQRDEVMKFADYTGDSYKLARHVSQHPEAEFIVFCGVHFMAESADVLSASHQQVLLPDLAAGCSMADMAAPDQLEMCWTDLEQMGIVKGGADPGHNDAGVLRRTGRRRLHIVECGGDVEMGMGARRADSVPARSASREKHGVQPWCSS
jgi:Quinolinate synthetase A protein